MNDVIVHQFLRKDTKFWNFLVFLPMTHRKAHGNSTVTESIAFLRTLVNASIQIPRSYLLCSYLHNRRAFDSVQSWTRIFLKIFMIIFRAHFFCAGKRAFVLVDRGCWKSVSWMNFSAFNNKRRLFPKDTITHLTRYVYPHSRQCTNFNAAVCWGLWQSRG